MQTVPGWAIASSRAAMLTPSPKILLPSTITSPRLTPIRNSSLRSGGIASLIARAARCISSAQFSVDDAREIRQQAIPCRADDPTAMRDDQRVDGAAELAQRLMRARLILAHQAAEPHHIRMQNGGEFPIPRGGCARRRRRVIEQGAHRGCV